MWPDTLYYLPGHGGRLHTGLGEALVERGWAVTGRETVGEFRAAGFQVQVDTVAQDLREHFWHPGAHVICNSFGAYLFLHAQTQMPAYPGRVLLLSPIVGAFEVHVGELDWQSVPAHVLAFAAPIGIPVTVVPGAGHMLGREYVGPLLDRWLPTRAPAG